LVASVITATIAPSVAWGGGERLAAFELQNQALAEGLFAYIGAELST